MDANLVESLLLVVRASNKKSDGLTKAVSPVRTKDPWFLTGHSSWRHLSCTRRIQLEDSAVCSVSCEPLPATACPPSWKPGGVTHKAPSCPNPPKLSFSGRTRVPNAKPPWHFQERDYLTTYPCIERVHGLLVGALPALAAEPHLSTLRGPDRSRSHWRCHW